MLVKQETIIVTETITDGELLNQQLEKEIRDAGYGSKLTTAKCYRTRWDMHETSDAFALLGQGAISVAKRYYTNECDEQGNPKDYDLRVSESWGLIYNRGDVTGVHQHWPSVWSYTYCVNGCKNCSPLVFPTVVENNEIYPEVGQLILFPGWVNHEVPEQKCDHERIMVAGNIMWDDWK
jgi:hypothetical protein